MHNLEENMRLLKFRKRELEVRELGLENLKVLQANPRSVHIYWQLYVLSNQKVAYYKTQYQFEENENQTSFGRGHSRGGPKKS